jgi:class 3 adenylate cyclase
VVRPLSGLLGQVGRGHDLAAVLLGGADVDQGRAVVAPDGLKDPPAEERKLVTVVLLDVLTPSGAVDPEQARLELDRCAGLVAEVLDSWGGTAERLVGGSVLAVFGVPTAHEDDAGRALQAGLEFLERAPMPVRAGVGTGEVIAPAGAGADPREIAGVVLDAAARLKEAAEPGTVVADERTRRVAGTGFEFGPPVTSAQVRDADPGGRHLVGVAGGPPPGRPRLLTVVGTAGVGKSRLVADATERLGVQFEAARTREHLASVAPAAEAWSLLEAALATYERLACAPRGRAVRARLRAPS